MLNLFIKLENGEPVNHPTTEENLLQFYPDLEVNNPPDGWGKFIREPHPDMNFFETVDTVNYELSEEYTKQFGTKTWHDVYTIREMTPEEKEQKCLSFFSKKLEDLHPSFNSVSGMFIPTKPMPQDGKFYEWVPNMNMWVDVEVLRSTDTTMIVNTSNSSVNFIKSNSGN